MNKTISINPDLFTFSSSKRKSKKREPKDGSEIKVKPPISEKQKKKQLRKTLSNRVHKNTKLTKKIQKKYKKCVKNGKIIKY